VVESEQSFVDFLEDTLIAEGGSRRVRSVMMLVRMVGLPGNQGAGRVGLPLRLDGPEMAGSSPRRPSSHGAETLVVFGPVGVGNLAWT